MKPSDWSLLTRIRHGLGERLISSASSTLEIRPFFWSSHKILMSILSSFIVMPLEVCDPDRLADRVRPLFARSQFVPLEIGGDDGVKLLKLPRHMHCHSINAPLLKSAFKTRRSCPKQPFS